MLKAPTTSAVCTYDHDAEARPSLVNPQLAACSELRELLTLEYLHTIDSVSRYRGIIYIIYNIYIIYIIYNIYNIYNV